jgi:hypothetical protein
LEQNLLHIISIFLVPFFKGISGRPDEEWSARTGSYPVKKRVVIYCPISGWEK